MAAFMSFMTTGDGFGCGAKLPRFCSMRRLEVPLSFLAIAISVAVLRVNAAQAQEPGRAAERLAIGKIEWAGNIPQPLRRTLADRLGDGLKAVAFEVLKPGGQVPIDGQAQECTDAACWQKSGQALGVSYLISAGVEEHEKSFAIMLELINGRTGVVVGTNRERCEICGAEEVGEKMSLAAATLRARLESLAQAPARIVIRTNPHGARVKLDGRAMGQTPVDTNLSSGQHTVLIEHEGYTPLERTISATSGVDETLDLDLVRVPTSFPFGAAGWAAIGAGVALAGGGLYFLSKDGEEVSCAAAVKAMDSDQKDCPEVYDTKVLGASLLGLSAVSITLGGVWLYMDQPGSEAPSNERAAAGGGGRTVGRKLPKFLLGTSGRF
jgi:hypothetical protein